MTLKDQKPIRWGKGMDKKRKKKLLERIRKEKEALEREKKKHVIQSTILTIGIASALFGVILSSSHIEPITKVVIIATVLFGAILLFSARALRGLIKSY